MFKQTIPNPTKREKGHLLEIHLLEKNARHQNLDCSTLFEQMTKKMKLLEKTPKSLFEQMQFLDQNDQLLEFKKAEKSGTCTAVQLKNRVS